jgi:hypothetical protein
MSKFIETTSGLLNTNCITFVRRLSEPRKVGFYSCEHVVHYIEDDQPCTTYTWKHNLAALTGEVIPALPGYFVVRACGSGDGIVLPPEPVIAWRVDHDGLFVAPILVDGAVDRCDNMYGVLLPDGAVEVAHDRSYASPEEFKTCVAEEARAKARAECAQA